MPRRIRIVFYFSGGTRPDIAPESQLRQAARDRQTEANRGVEVAIYYQHIGRELWRRDGPRSIGTDDGGLRRFSFGDIHPFLGPVDPTEQAAIRGKAHEYAPTGFQVWGIPSGAEQVLRAMDTGDFLLLLETDFFRYAGQVIHRVSVPCWELSRHIWGEQRFPLIVLLQGQMIGYPWTEFIEQFRFDPKYHMRGNTMRLGPDRVASSPSGSEEAFVATLLTEAAVRPQDLQTDFSGFAESLKGHLRLVRQRGLQQTFRKAVMDSHGARCAVCDLALPAVLDAAHIIPKEENGSDDPRNGLTLCVLHHRMFDAGLFGIEPATRMLKVRGGYSPDDLRITRPGIGHLKPGPHADALRWRWDQMPLPQGGPKTE